ncbi:hypothetical protein [Alloscardovia omnicolens]
MGKQLTYEEIIDFYDHLLTENGYDEDAREMRLSADAGEAGIAVSAGVFYANLRGLIVPKMIVKQTLEIAQYWDDDEAIDACKSLLEKAA